MYVFEVWVVLPLALAALPQTVFVLLYSLPQFGAPRWWRDDVGRALAFKSLTFALVLDTLAIRIIHSTVTADELAVRFAPPSRWVDWLGSALYWLALFAICYQLWVLVKRRVRERQAALV